MGDVRGDAPCPCGSGKRYKKCCQLENRVETLTRALLLKASGNLMPRLMGFASERFGLEPLEVAWEEFGAVVGLLAAESGKPGLCGEFAESALEGFDFAEFVVLVEVLDGLLVGVGYLPELAVECFHVGGGNGGLVDFEVEIEAGGELVHELIGFVEVVAGVNEDDGGVWCDACDKMEHQGGLSAE